MNQENRKIYEQGFEAGVSEGMRRAILIIQLATTSKTKVFKEAMLGDADEAKELIRSIIKQEERSSVEEI